MVSKKSFLILVVASAIVISGLVFYYISTQQELISLLEGQTQFIKETEISTVPATGNVDDATEALLKEVNDESSALSNLEGDASLIDSDSQEVDDFGQSINENDF
jgi:hypothetical protein